ncbi:MAG: mechanosensitive ion channel [Thermoguttaceae bacterium]|nr:mechanosensitive ion channel [Thermoguttaceae bacterium]
MNKNTYSITVSWTIARLMSAALFTLTILTFANPGMAQDTPASQNPLDVFSKAYSFVFPNESDLGQAIPVDQKQPEIQMGSVDVKEADSEEDEDVVEVEDISEEEIPEDKIPREVYPAEMSKPSESVGKDASAEVETPAEKEASDKSAEPEKAERQAEPAAEESTKTEEKPEIDANALRVFQRIQSPRALVEFFLESTYKRNYDDALLTMDLSKLPSDIQDVEKYMLVYHLEQIIIRLKKFSVEKIPEQYDKDRYFLWPDKDYEAILLLKQPDGAWKFASATVANIENNYKLIENQPPVFTQKGWMKRLPESAFQTFWGMMYIQWILLIAFFIIGYLVYKIAPVLTVYLILMPLRFVKLGENYIELLKRALSPLATLAMLYIWYRGLVFVHAAPNVIQWAKWIIHPLGIVLAMISLIRLCDVFAEWLRRRFVRSSNKTGNVLVELTNRCLKCLAFFLGVIGIAQVFGFSALGIISGMGIGGIAVALAAQQTIANFFGSLTILLDQPFTIGDWVVVNGVEGSVESIGLRSTRIRSFYNSLIVIPNSSLATSTIDNMGRRQYRSYKTFVGIEYGTPVELIEAFCGGIRALIESYPNTRKDDIRVAVNELADSSINILLVCFFIAHSADEENASRQRLILDVIRLANRLGVSFAFPSVTQYQIKQDAPTYPTLTEVKNNADAPDHFGAKLGKEIASEGQEDDASVV